MWTFLRFNFFLFRLLPVAGGFHLSLFGHRKILLFFLNVHKCSHRKWEKLQYIGKRRRRKNIFLENMCVCVCVSVRKMHGNFGFSINSLYIFSVGWNWKMAQKTFRSLCFSEHERKKWSETRKAICNDGRVATVPKIFTKTRTISTISLFFLSLSFSFELIWVSIYKERCVHSFLYM